MKKNRFKNKKRIVVKIGSSSLQHKKTGQLDFIKLEKLVRELCDLKNQDIDVCPVSPSVPRTFRPNRHVLR